MRLRFEIAHRGNVPLIAGCMRERDVAEILAGWGKEPAQAMLDALDASYYARTCFYGMEPLGIYGLSPLCAISGFSQVWIFCTRHVDNHKFAFARASRLALEDVKLHAQSVANFIDANDAPARRWLEWLGGKYVLPPERRGGRLFQQFILGERCLRA